MIKKSIIRVCFFAVAMICTLFISCTDFNYTERRYNERKDGIESRYSDYTIASQDYSESESELSCFLARYPLTDGIPDYSQDFKLLEYKSDCAYYSLQLENWQSSYDYQVAKLKSEGSAKLSQLIDEWTDAEVLASDRGTAGSMGFYLKMLKQKVVDYAGEDMSLENLDDGSEYSIQMKSLISELQMKKRSYEQQIEIAEGNCNDRLLDLQHQYENLCRKENLMKARLENAIKRLEDYLSYLDEIHFDYSNLIKRNEDETYTLVG